MKWWWIVVLVLLVGAVIGLSYQPEYVEKDNEIGKFGVTVELVTKNGKIIKLVPSSYLQTILPQLTYWKVGNDEVSHINYKVYIKAEGASGSIKVHWYKSPYVVATSKPIDEGARHSMGGVPEYSKKYVFTTTTVPIDGQWHLLQSKSFYLGELCPAPTKHDVATYKVTITCCELVYDYGKQQYYLGRPPSVSFTVKSYRGISPSGKSW